MVHFVIKLNSKYIKSSNYNINVKNTNDGVVYTEAGLYSGDKLIAMRTFKGKVKESTVAFRIQWSVMF